MNWPTMPTGMEKAYLVLLVWLLSEGRRGTGTVGAWMRRLIERLTSIGGGRSGAVTWHRRPSASTAQLAAHLFLVRLKGRGPSLEQGILDGSNSVWGKDRSRINRSRNGLLPGLQHLLQLVASPLINRCVHIHEGLIQVLAKE